MTTYIGRLQGKNRATGALAMLAEGNQRLVISPGSAIPHLYLMGNHV